MGRSSKKASDVIYERTLCEKSFGRFRFGFSQYFLKCQEAPIIFEIQDNFHFDPNQDQKGFDVVSFQVCNSKDVFKAVRIFLSQIIAFFNWIPPLNEDNFNSISKGTIKISFQLLIKSSFSKKVTKV